MYAIRSYYGPCRNACWARGMPQAPAKNRGPAGKPAGPKGCHPGDVSTAGGGHPRWRGRGTQLPGGFRFSGLPGSVLALGDVGPSRSPIVSFVTEGEGKSYNFV